MNPTTKSGSRIVFFLLFFVIQAKGQDIGNQVSASGKSESEDVIFESGPSNPKTMYQLLWDERMMDRLDAVERNNKSAPPAQEDQVRENFVLDYVVFRDALTQDDKGRAQNSLDRLAATAKLSAMESLGLDLARFMFAQKYQSEETQLAALEIIFGEGGVARDYLDDGPGFELLKARLQLYVSLNLYREAVNLHQSLQQAGAGEEFSAYEKIIQRLVELADDDTAYQVELKFGGAAGRDILLHKRKFYLASVTGIIDTLTMYCGHKKANLDIEPMIEFVIPESMTECRLTVRGEAGTSITLVMY